MITRALIIVAFILMLGLLVVVSGCARGYAVYPTYQDDYYYDDGYYYDRDRDWDRDHRDRDFDRAGREHRDSGESHERHR